MSSQGYVPADAKEMFSYYHCLKCGHRMPQEKWWSMGMKHHPVCCERKTSFVTIYGRPEVKIEAHEIARAVFSTDQLAAILADGGTRRLHGILKDLAGFRVEPDDIGTINKEVDEENGQIEYWQVLED